MVCSPISNFFPILEVREENDGAKVMHSGPVLWYDDFGTILGSRHVTNRSALNPADP